MDFAGVLDVDDARLLELQPEVVALARALAHAREHRHAAVLLGQVVDELLDDDGLAHAGAAEEADLAAAQVGLDEVDDLDAGLEHLELDRLLRRSVGAGRWMGRRLVALHRPQLVHGLADDVQHAAEGPQADGHGDGSAGVDGLHAAHHAVGGQHADAAHAVLAEVLLHLGDDVDGDSAARAVVLDAHGVVDGGHLLVELDVDDGADDLHDAPTFSVAMLTSAPATARPGLL